MKYSFVATSSSIVVTGPSGKLVTVQQTAPNYNNLLAALKALKEDPNDETLISIVEKHLDTTTSVETWAKGLFKLNGKELTYKGDKVPSELTERMFQMSANGDNPISLMNFWEKLNKNPSWRSVQQLWGFLKNSGHPILPNGNFLAYKGVKSNYTDAHSGTVDNKPGVVNEMPRNKISDDPSQTCHFGYHVGALEYARGFAAVVVVCEVDPSDVVCIPNDYNAQKMRVCKYRVRGNHNGQLLPSSSYELETDLGTGSQVVHEKEKATKVAFEEEQNTPVTKLSVLPSELKMAKERKIQAIKDYRDRTGQPLKESVAAIEAALSKASKPAPKVERKVTRDDSKVTKVTKIPRAFKKVHAMTMRQLLDVDIGTLRSYATQVLHIVGASKILGGKAALTAQIVKVRRNFR